MKNEKFLMRQLDELVRNGYGDTLMYACDIAADAALEGYKKATRRAVTFAGVLIGIGIVGAASTIKKAIKKHYERKRQIQEEP